MTGFTNADDGEIGKFDKVSDIWWDLHGEMGTLQVLNPLRTKFVMENFPGRRPRILDVGCGGGILSEALARAGAQVTGIDLSRPAVEVARRHARDQGLDVDYRFAAVEEIAETSAGGFDAVTCMEMLEHVPRPQDVVAACARVLTPDGHAFFSTINRTPKAFLFAIVGGEYVLRLLPRGTHVYKKLIRPRELRGWAQASRLEYLRLSSLIYNPFRHSFTVAEGREDVNYMVHFRRAKAEA